MLSSLRFLHILCLFYVDKASFSSYVWQSVGGSFDKWVFREFDNWKRGKLQSDLPSGMKIGFKCLLYVTDQSIEDYAVIRVKQSCCLQRPTFEGNVLFRDILLLNDGLHDDSVKTEMDRCMLCQDSLENGKPKVTIAEKGSQSINAASKKRGDTVKTWPGDTVHQHCRRTYCNPKAITLHLKQQKCESENIENVPLLRSSNSFQFAVDCLFCGQSTIQTEKKKKKGVFQVRTEDFQRNIEDICKQRDDEWSLQVLGRLEFARDLHAADAVYHQSCSVNFRTQKMLPKAFSPKPDKQSRNESTKGRPCNRNKMFLKVVEYLQDNDNEQITITDLVDKMKEFSGDEAYSAVHLKKRLIDHFGDEIVVTEIQGKSNVVTFRGTAKSILQKFYKRTQTEDPESEKQEIILTAAKLIKNDIRTRDASKSEYPLASDISSCQNNLEYVPNSLCLFLKSIFSEKNANLKIASIGQSIMQAARPRISICPLQIALGVQLHHQFASKFLIDTLYNLGFCSSYFEVQKFESSAAIAQGLDIPGYEAENGILQFVADNVDHNLRTLDGFDTFHGMGIIAGITPGTKGCNQVARVAVSADELLAVGKIDIKYFKSAGSNVVVESLKYAEIKDLRIKDSTWKLDLLAKVVWPIKSPMPSWSGLMQTFQQGQYPGQSSVTFFPMIDMNPSDCSCIYTTLHFVSGVATRYGVKAIITFDQPLYWKALNIIASEPDGSSLKQIVLKLGGFHTIMSFLGSIGHLMSGTGLEEVLETIYASNAVTHMISGKAVDRAIRGHILIDTALNAMMISKVFNVDLPKDNETEYEDAMPSSDEASVPMPQVDLTNSAFVDYAEDDRELLAVVSSMYEQLVNGECSVNEICQNPLLDKVQCILTRERTLVKASRNGTLWLQYCDMVDILKQFIKAERTGDWNLHLQSLYSMLPFLAASGHNLYTKSAYFYLAQMQNLKNDHPEIYDLFQKGHHVIRRSDRFWAGLSSDLVIEQVLMRSVKTSGGMTRGRGMEETQRTQWLLSMPARAEYNCAMQELTDTRYCSSDQHKETMKSRKKRDHEDTLTILAFLNERNPFANTTASSKHHNWCDC